MRREELLAAPPRPAGRLVPLERGWVLPLVGAGASLLPLGRGWASPLDGGGSPPFRRRVRREQRLRPAGRVVTLESGWVLPLDGGGSSLLPLGRGWVSRLEGANSQPLEYVARLVFRFADSWCTRAAEFFKNKC